MNHIENVFLQSFVTPHGMVPFDRITLADYEPAIRAGIEQQNAQIQDIVNNSAPPTFENTIVALERSGDVLDRTLGVFYPMLSAHADDELMALANRMAPILADHTSNITLNRALWKRIKIVYNDFDASQYDSEDCMLLRKTYRHFLRAGAALTGNNRKRFRTLSTRMVMLSLQFEQNLLKATSAGRLWLSADDLSGLPGSAVDAAALAAAEAGKPDRFLITLHAPSYMTFMKYSSRRDLREQLFKMRNSLCCNGGEWDNSAIAVEIANTRLAMARLLGYSSFADYKLETTMAGTPAAVHAMLERLRVAYRPAWKREFEQLTAFATQMEGHPVEIMPWDYSYYANKHRQAMFDIDDEMLRPYFLLDNVVRGVFGLATRLYGLTFTPNVAAPVYHPEVRVYDVADADGSYLGTLYTDFFPRATKQSGAWMTDLREQCVDASGADVRPLVTLTMNFTRPTSTEPSLLTFGEVRTLLHEFGHGLHSLLSRCKYCTTSGTNVLRDFVELPSQFNENFLCQREFLDSFAKHYKTGEPIPADLIERQLSSGRYGAGYACMRQLGFGYLDMAWHSIEEPYDGRVSAFEASAMAPVNVFAPVDGCLTSTQFGHIFSGGYAAGYYGYKWAEVLDADAFSRFEQEGIFNQATAQSFRKEVLERGGSEDPSVLFRRFRGRDPQIDALLHRDGITAN